MQIKHVLLMIGNPQLYLFSSWDQVLFLGYLSMKQATVACSSIEAEYRAASATICVALSLGCILEGLEVPQNQPTILYCDRVFSSLFVI